MAVTISGTTGVAGNLTGNVTGAVTGNASTASLATTIADSSVVRSKVGYNGCILQVVQGFMGFPFLTTSTSPIDVPGLSAVITPSSVNSKILVSAQTYISRSGNANDAVVNLIRNDSVLVGNSTSGGTVTGIFGQTAGQYTYEAKLAATTYLDSPATISSVTYKVQLRVYSSGTAYIGQRAAVPGDFITPSNITLMEVAGGYAS
jgi:hypothetical protein